VLMQIMLLPTYARVPFSQSYWTFTFPVTTTTNYCVRRLAAWSIDGVPVAAWAFLGGATVFVVALGVCTVWAKNKGWRRPHRRGGAPIRG